MITKRIMTLNRNYFALSGLALLATMFVACGDDDPSEVYVGDLPQYQKAYITTGVSYPNGTAFKGSFSGKVQLTEDGKVIYAEAEGMNISGNGSFDAEIYFRTNYAVQQAISGTVAVAPDAEAFVTRYNAEHQTECKLLSAEYYTIENGHATIEAGSKSASIHVAVDTELPWEQGEYLLPLSMTLDSGTEIALSEDQNSICLKYTVTKESYRMISSDEFDVESYSAANAANAADFDRSTKWSCSGSEDLYILFKEPQYVSRIFLLDCTSYYYVWMSYEDTPDNLFGGSYFYTTNASGLTEFDPAAQISYNDSRKVKRVVIRNYYGSISDIYFLVHD